MPQVKPNSTNAYNATSCSVWFVFFNDQLLLKKAVNGSGKTYYQIPEGVAPPHHPGNESVIHEVVFPNGETAYTFSIDHIIEENDEWVMINLRSSFELLASDVYQTAGKARQLLYWEKHSRFCPTCGTATEQKASTMKRCPLCGYELYPPIATAGIVLIRREKEILLVRARNFRGNFHGLVAGFVEPGETLEQCVEREVMEETGLKIKNITYFGSQPWPYPCGLMTGFIADYESGELKIQEEELHSAAFYDKEHLPEIPQKLSIARRMIDWWMENGE